MTHRFADLMFTESVKATQEYYGSRDHNARLQSNFGPNDQLTSRETEFIALRDTLRDVIPKRRLRNGTQNNRTSTGRGIVYRSNSAHIIGVILIATILSACASTENVTETENPLDVSAGDPWEPANRGIYAVNRGLDRVTLKPVAKGYRKVLPAFMRRGVGNFFGNLRTPLTIVNQLLQGKGRAALSDTGRLLLNSTVGIGGLFDPATSVGLEEHKEDFGQTLATWGVPDGPFVMVPLLGPRTLRDAITIPLDLFAHPLYHYENASVRDKLWGLEAVTVRARLLAGESLIEGSSDPYITIRDAYQQNRQYLIYDGEPPDDYGELFDEFLEDDTSPAN